MLYRIDIPYGIRKFTLGETAIRHRIFGYGAAVAEPGIPSFSSMGSVKKCHLRRVLIKFLSLALRKK